uniref:Uncharacterized protein n=1 Tax=Anguilla anguilla TaxID=7936 RepID=A0A0E9XDF0_ANGAN
MLPNCSRLIVSVNMPKTFLLKPKLDITGLIFSNHHRFTYIALSQLDQNSFFPS